jgi:hypothetical protein
MWIHKEKVIVLISCLMLENLSICRIFRICSTKII